MNYHVFHHHFGLTILNFSETFRTFHLVSALSLLQISHHGRQGDPRAGCRPYPPPQRQGRVRRLPGRLGAGRGTSSGMLLLGQSWQSQRHLVWPRPIVISDPFAGWIIRPPLTGPPNHGYWWEPRIIIIISNSFGMCSISIIVFRV